MKHWCRVFASSAEPIGQASLLECVAQAGIAGTATFATEGESDAWCRADLELETGTVLSIERFNAAEPGIRAELNTWAAHVEQAGDSSNVVRLMEQIIQTRQLFTLQVFSPDVLNHASVLCQLLAELTDGVWQRDELGFFDGAGKLLLSEMAAAE